MVKRQKRKTKKDKEPKIMPKDVMNDPPEKGMINSELDPTNPEDLAKIEEEARQIQKEVVEPEHQEKAKKALEDFREIIETEEQLLKKIPEDRRVINVTDDDQLWRFRVKPIEAGDNFKSLELDLDLLSNIPVETREAIIKKGQGKVLTREEERLIREFDFSDTSNVADATLESAIYILSNYVTPPYFDGDAERRKNYWIQAPFSFKLFIATEAFKLLGLDGETKFKLFQANG